MISRWGIMICALALEGPSGNGKQVAALGVLFQMGGLTCIRAKRLCFMNIIRNVVNDVRVALKIIHRTDIVGKIFY
jgi:hypothetical protein